MRKMARAIVIHDGKLLLMKRFNHGERYYVVPGGGIDAGETPEQTVKRELIEETSITVRPRAQVYLETADKFGEAVYLLADYVSGQPKLSPDSEEAEASKDGQNTFEPMWVALDEVPNLKIYPEVVGKQLVHDLKNGFQSGVKHLKGDTE